MKEQPYLIEPLMIPLASISTQSNETYQPMFFPLMVE